MPLDFGHLRPSTASKPCGASCMEGAKFAARAARRSQAHYNGGVCKSAGLYISLNQCSLSPGLVHCLVSVIVSR